MNCTMSISPYNYTSCNSTWTCLQSKVRGRFYKILWPSQNIWTLPIKLQSAKTSPLKTEKTTNRPCLAMTSKPCWTEAPCPVAKKIIVKLRYCEKVTIFEKISHFFWSLLSNVKTRGRFFQVFMAFSENLNFKWVHWRINSLLCEKWDPDWAV